MKDDLVIREQAIKAELLKTYFTLNQKRPSEEFLTMQANALASELPKWVHHSEIAECFTIHRQKSAFMPTLATLYEVWKTNPKIHKPKPVHEMLIPKISTVNADDHYRVYLRLRELEGAKFTDEVRSENKLDLEPTIQEAEAYKAQCIESANSYPKNSEKRKHFIDLSQGEYPPKRFKKPLAKVG